MRRMQMRRALRLRVERLRWLRGLWRLLLVLGTLSRVLVEIRQTRPDLCAVAAGGMCAR